MSKKFFINHEDGFKQKGLFWECQGAKKNIVLATGMQEKAARYDDFAKFLNSKGFNVWCLDAIGQGENVEKIEDLQKWPVGGFKKCVDGIALTIKEAKKNKLETYVFGHSMGSFMIQSLLERYPGIVSKYVICGSNKQGKLMAAAGLLLAKIVVNKKNWDLPSTFLSNIAIGGYAKAFKNPRTPLDWLSVDNENVDKYIADPYCGHTNTNGFWKGFLEGLFELYQKKNLYHIDTTSKILLIAGAEDPVGNMSKGVVALEKMYRKLGIKDLTCLIYEGMRHEILNEKNHQKVYNDILLFLNK